jgi:hypothetical protein
MLSQVRYALVSHLLHEEYFTELINTTTPNVFLLLHKN